MKRGAVIVEDGIECGGKECRVLVEHGVREIRDRGWNIKNGVWIAELC